MGNQRNIKKERKKKEFYHEKLVEISRSHTQVVATVLGYQKFCKEKNLEESTNEYLVKFLNSLKDEKGLIDLAKLENEMKGNK